MNSVRAWKQWFLILSGSICVFFWVPGFAGEDTYAIGAYKALTTETVYVFGPLPVVCDADRLKAFSAIQGSRMPPSLTEIGYACATRSQMATLRLLPPICEMLDSKSFENGANGWEYVCYLGTVDRFIHPPPAPTASELEQRRQAQEAAQVAQRQAAESTAKSAAIQANCEQFARSWVYQHNKDICLQNMNARRARSPRMDDPEPLCERAGKHSADEPALLAESQYVKYMRSIGIAIYPACARIW